MGCFRPLPLKKGRRKDSMRGGWCFGGDADDDDDGVFGWVCFDGDGDG